MACGVRTEMFDSFQSQLASCPLEGEVKAKRVRAPIAARSACLLACLTKPWRHRCRKRSSVPWSVCSASCPPTTALPFSPGGALPTQPFAAHLALRARMRDTIERQVAHLRETFNIWCEKSLPLEDSADLAREFSTRKEATFNVSRCAAAAIAPADWAAAARPCRRSTSSWRCFATFRRTSSAWRGVGRRTGCASTST